MSFADATHAACTKCKFFDNHSAMAEADEGLCRFNPPVSQPSPEAHGLWPVVSSQDWCGHFSQDAMRSGMAD